MEWLKRWQQHPWWIESVAIGGLVLAIAIVGLVGLGINARVKHITERMVQYDVELSDRSDDFLVVVLETRHYHQNITFAGPTGRRVVEFESSYRRLQEAIDELEQLPMGNYSSLLQVDELRTLTERYYRRFHPAIDLYTTDPQAFTQASTDSLRILTDLENAALALEQLTEDREALSISSVEEEANHAQWVLLVVLGGLILVSIGLSYLMLRNLYERQRTAAKLAQALQLKNDFIADASHELRTPLTVLRANAEVALQLDRTCVHIEFLEEIVREAERMTRLVEDLLLLARSDGDSLPLNLETVEIEPFLAELVERAQMLAHQHRVHCQQELTAAGRVRIDPTRIEQAILILVDNAAQYSPEGKPILLRSATDSKSLFIEVIDYGIGIPEENLPFIFERFYRVDKARSRQQGGIGLGLAIAKSLVEAHGGHIEAKSILNQGTQMRLSLPLLPTSPTHHVIPEPAQALV